MSTLLLPSRLRQQPQQGAQLDRSNRFAANALAIVSAAQDINHATGKQLVRGGTGYTTGIRPEGRAGLFRKNSYLQTETLPAIGTQSFVEFWYGYTSSDQGNQGGSSADPTFLTGSPSTGIAIVSRIGNRKTEGYWGAIYNWSNGYYDQFNAAGEVLNYGALTLLLVVRRQTGMEFWRNGRMVAFIAQAPVSIAATPMLLGSFVNDVYWTSSSDAILAGRVLTPVEPSAAELRAFSENPWALFQVPRDRAALAAISGFAAPAADMSLTGAAASVASASAGLATAVRLAGNATAVATAAGALATSVRLAGAATAVASASGALAASSTGLSGVAISVASGAGTLTTGIRLAGAGAAAAAGAGTLSTAIRLVGGAGATASGSAALGTRVALTGTAAAVATAAGLLAEGAPPMFDVSKISPSRIVVFEGSGSRIVTFEGSGPRMRIAQMSLNMPTKDGEKWVVDRDPDEESWYGAEITTELRDRNTTAKTVELVLLGVAQLAEPAIQVVTIDGVSRTFVAAFLGGDDGAPPEGWKWVARVRCANGERFDKTTWFNEVDP